MRVTIRSTYTSYMSSLNKTFSGLNTAREKVETGRRFTRGSEDPAAAAREYQLKRDYMNNQDYLNTASDVLSKFDALEGSMQAISKAAEKVYLEGISVIGTKDQAQREIIAASIRETQRSMVADLNAQFGGQYLFGGTSTADMPFQLSDNGTLTFRGIDVNSTNPADQAALQAMAEEKMFVDLGFGLKFNGTNTIDQSSAYNTAFPGIKYVGFGTNADSGNPNNIISLMGELADAIEQEPMNDAVVDSLKKDFDGARKQVLVGITQLGSNTQFLENTKSRLDSNQLSINEKLLATAYMELPDAMMDYSHYKYAYDQALKIGADILPMSLADFLK